MSESQAQGCAVDCSPAAGDQKPGAEPMQADDMTYMMYVGLQGPRIKEEGKKKEKSTCCTLGGSPTNHGCKC